MAHPLYQVDSFTNRPFRGNPAAVCLLAEPADPAWMQSVAAEMNLSETAFLVPQDGVYGLRWFTPAAEVDLCGHATLASAHVLWTEGHLPETAPAVFETLSGTLTATRNGAWIEMDFPAWPAAACATPDGLEAALGVTPTFVGRSGAGYLVPVESEDALRAITPDFGALAAAAGDCVMVTSPATITEGVRLRVALLRSDGSGSTRTRSPGRRTARSGRSGTNASGATRSTGFQASARGGVVKVEMRGDRVIISGQAVTVLRGSLE